MGVKQPDITVHIGELVLHGFAPGDRHAVSEALQAELTRLFAEDRVPGGFSETRHIVALDGGSFTLRADGRPKTAGVEIARAVYRSMGGKPEGR